MEWLKDKKNLPIVAALAVVFLLAAGGLIAFELGVFPSGGGSTATAPPAPATPPPGAPPVGIRRPPLTASALRPAAPVPGKGVPGKPAAAAGPVPENPDKINPAVGPDPFYIPNGQKRLASNTATPDAAKLTLREMIGPLNLFQIHPPAPQAPPPPIGGGGVSGGVDPTSNYRLIGVITGTDGINAILEVGGQSQSVKPGDSLPDGSRVQDIQTNSLTLRTAGGSVINLPLSAGSPDPGTANPGFNGQPGFNNQSVFNGPPPPDNN